MASLSLNELKYRQFARDDDHGASSIGMHKLILYSFGLPPICHLIFIPMFLLLIVIS